MSKLNSFQAKNLMNDYMSISHNLETMLNQVLSLCEEISICDTDKMDPASSKFIIKFRELINKSDTKNLSFGLNKFNYVNFPRVNSRILAYSCINNGYNDKERNAGTLLGHYGDKGVIVSKIHNKGDFLFGFDSGGDQKSFTINTKGVLSEVIGNINSLIGLSTKVSNSVIFRHRKIGDRTISLINPVLKKYPLLYKNIEDSFKGFSKTFYTMYEKMFLNIGDNESYVTGFIKGKSYIDHASSHLGCRSAISVDISKFYNNISITNIIENNLFHKTLISSIEQKTGVPFEAASFSNPEKYDILNKMLSMMNVQFTGLMYFLTHNGILPTGAHYSPNISNILLSNVDKEIIKEINKVDSNLTYTRYADDICVSSARDKNESGEYILTIKLVKDIEVIIRDHGFHLNYDKTKIMGPRDRKKIAGVILDHTSNPPRLSIGSEKKLTLKERYDGKSWSELTASDLGTINWVKCINESQYNFVCSGISGRNTATIVVTDEIPF